MSDGSNIVVLPSEPEPAVIERLERLLEEARRGELIGLAYAADYRTEFEGTFVGRKVNLSIIGELRLVEARLVEAIREESGG